MARELLSDIKVLPDKIVSAIEPNLHFVLDGILDILS